MNARWIGWVAVVMLGLGASATRAQDWPTADPYDPWRSITRTEAGPVVSLNEAPNVPRYAPAVQYAYAAPTVPQYYAAPVVTYRPIVAAPYVNCAACRPAVSVAQPYATYSPIVVPATAYRPVPVYNTAAAPVPAGPKVIVKPKIVYVEGQPIRNFLRAITP